MGEGEKLKTWSSSNHAIDSYINNSETIPITWVNLWMFQKEKLQKKYKTFSNIYFNDSKFT